MQGFLHINDALIEASLPVQLGILQICDEFPIHQHINVLHQRQCADFLPAVACIQPDIFLGVFQLDLPRQPFDFLPIARIKRIAAAEGNAADIVAGEQGEQLLLCRRIKDKPPLRVPRDGIMTLRGLS